jgi:hypothetical protein
MICPLHLQRKKLRSEGVQVKLVSLAPWLFFIEFPWGNLVFSMFNMCLLFFFEASGLLARGGDHRP